MIKITSSEKTNIPIEGKEKNSKKQKRMVWVFVILAIIFISIVSAGSKSNPAPKKESSVENFKSPDQEILFEINLSIGVMRQSSELTTQQDNELANLTLEIQDVWNKEMGYFVYVAPSSPQELSDFQVKTVLSIIQNLRKQKSDKWFDVMIFDDPSIAKTSRESIGKYDNLSEKDWCSQIFSHYRGAYSWNPTNQHEEINLNVNCNWESIL